jgi:hypothetical protein
MRLDTTGVSLIEIMLALTIMATALLGMGQLMFQVARHAEQSTVASYRSAAVTSAVAWVLALPWDSLDVMASCTSDTIGVFEYDQCLTVQTLSPKLKRTTVAIQSTGRLTIRPDTVVVDRNKPRLISPLSP